MSAEPSPILAATLPVALAIGAEVGPAALVEGALLGLGAALTPGPLLALAFVRTWRGGWRGGLAVVPAPLVSDAPIVALCLVVVGQLGTVFLGGLSLAGALFLAWLARGAWREARAPLEAEKAPSERARRGGWRGLADAALVNALGPGPWVFWTSVMGPLVIESWREAPVLGAGVVALFYASFLLALALFVGLVALARDRAPAERFALIAGRIGALLLAALGVALALRGVRLLGGG